MTSAQQNGLMHKYSKSVKTIRNRIVQVEFRWSRADPCQSYRLQILEERFRQAQKNIRSKKLAHMRFEQFIDLITPLFANDAVEISHFVLRSTFDYLFDQNSNGSIEPQEFEPLFLLLHGNDASKLNLFHEHLRQIFSNRSNHISFKEFADFVNGLNSFSVNLAHRFAKLDCDLVIHGHPSKENVYRNSQVKFVSNQIRSIADVQSLAEDFQHIDILIINQPHRGYHRGSIEEFPVEKWTENIDSNLHTTFALVKTLWTRMKRQYFGRIIHIANEHNFIANEYQSACTTVHYALIGLNKALAVEGSPYGITSNIICPGSISAKPFEGNDHVQTLTDLVLFLCTDQARSITGQLIPWTNVENI
ncbi:unnamed protein product [Adineta ricciae]|uniref:3-oxoacyl-[acyl-carrier-protein] reductase n=1 Tax=Adineta ricciae TaxID=249248 RepID=A0A814K3H4_ADIRI|nr:unnamed protein product [Adineta ricciae]CAF1281530.1 unnamed protein product [Adineta ricciae]